MQFTEEIYRQISALVCATLLPGPGVMWVLMGPGYCGLCDVHCALCRWLTSTGGTWLSVRPTRVSHITCYVPIKGGAMFLATVSASGGWRLSYIVVTIGERPCKHVWDPIP